MTRKKEGDGQCHSNFLSRPFSKKEDWYVAAILGGCHCLLVTIIYQYVPQPYMDEIFHIRQTRRYCVGDLSWDPMITTPPALYLISIPFCGGYERYVNSVLIFLIFPGLCRLRRVFGGGDVLSTSLVTLALPVLLHSSVLFYTDLLSVGCVVWGLSVPSAPKAAVLFLAACLTRQTNIVWAGMYALVRMYHRFCRQRTFNSLITSVLKLWPFVLLAVSFLMFVFYNGGIVLGDPSAHRPCVHLAQFLYFLLFCTLHSWPQTLIHISTTLHHSLKFSSVVLLVLSVFAIKFGTFDHPYLLADNRHVPFYLWRWFLSDSTKRLALAPVYVVSFLYLNTVSRNSPHLVRAIFTLCVVCVVVPAHLIEPRYFIIPYVLWRVSATNVSTFATYCEILSQITVFSVVTYLFLFKPFMWQNEPGVLQRFMW